MADITSQKRNLFTDKIVEVFNDRREPTGYLRSKFKNTMSPTKYVSIEVQREVEYVAKDVVRGASGNLVSNNKSSLKTFLPPYWFEEVAINDLDLYDRVFGAQDYSNAQVVGAMVNRIADRLQVAKNGVERAKEVACAQALLTGIVTLQNGDNIDFKRKSTSLVNFSGSYWNGSVDPNVALSQAGDFIRKEGKSGAFEFDVILGAGALAALFANEKFQKTKDLANMYTGSVTMPTSANGALYHGRVSAGSYILNLYSYPQYRDVNGTSTPYIDDNKFVMIAQDAKLTFAHALVPQLIGANGEIPMAQEFAIFEQRDEYNGVHKMAVRSAATPILTSVDRIFTGQVLS